MDIVNTSPYSRYICPSLETFNDVLHRLTIDNVGIIFNHTDFSNFVLRMKPLLNSYTDITITTWLECATKIKRLFLIKTKDDHLAWNDLQNTAKGGALRNPLNICEIYPKIRLKRLYMRISPLSDSKLAACLQLSLSHLTLESQLMEKVDQYNFIHAKKKELIDLTQQDSTTISIPVLIDGSFVNYRIPGFEIPSAIHNKVQEILRSNPYILWHKENRKHYIFLNIYEDKTSNYSKVNRYFKNIKKHPELPEILKMALDGFWANVRLRHEISPHEIKFRAFFNDRKSMYLSSGSTSEVIPFSNMIWPILLKYFDSSIITTQEYSDENIDQFKNFIPPNFDYQIKLWKIYEEKQASFYNFLIQKLIKIINRNGETFLQYTKDLTHTSKNPRTLSPYSESSTRFPKWDFSGLTKQKTLGKKTIHAHEDTPPKHLPILSTDGIKRWDMLPSGRKPPTYSFKENQKPLFNGLHTLIDQFCHLGEIEDLSKEDQRIAVPIVLSYKKATIIGTLFFRIDRQSKKCYHRYIELDRKNVTQEPFIPVKIEDVAKYEGCIVAYNKRGDVFIDDLKRQLCIKLENTKKE